MPRVVILQNAFYEDAGLLQQTLTNAGLETLVVQAYAGQEVPLALDDARGVAVLNGPMSMDDAGRFKFLKNEMFLLENALEEGRPILGLELGAQVLASVLEADIRFGAVAAVGWQNLVTTAAAAADPATAALPATFVSLVWHEDQCELPAGATPLLTAPFNRQAAWKYRRNAYGLGFRLELTAATLENMMQAYALRLTEKKIDAKALAAAAAAHLAAIKPAAEKFFTAWAAMCKAD